jgi:signal transduction histidine kinase
VTLTREPSGLVALEVLDRGPGVPVNLREGIFEPFYRLPSSAEGEGGAGLGLSLARQVARRHGGDVVCLSREGGGSRFRATLAG